MNSDVKQANKEVAVQMIIGIAPSISATVGAKIERVRPKILQTPQAVLQTTVGNSQGVDTQQPQSAKLIPNLANSTKIGVATSFDSASINTRPKPPIVEIRKPETNVGFGPIFQKVHAQTA